ncbi:hypothetical protein [Streptomyces sp. NPDC057287]|uniref:hypothetical protein n=1 Tax=Streptomyces sp. NPDC057287 TaxID=3346086 RepID=UPI0036301204
MRSSARKRSARAGQGAGSTLTGRGIAAVLAAAGLLVTAIPSAHADAATVSAASEATADAGTETPSLVTGLNEEATATGTAADAARGHLKSKKSRYHIADTSAKDLASAGTTAEGGGRETVRLQQKYKGVAVLGGQYLVRMTKKDGKRTVTGTSGSYFTELKLDTVTPEVSERTAIERAVSAVSTQLAGGLLRAPAKGEKPGGKQLTGTAEGVTILPHGTGVLTRQITVTGISPLDGQPVKQQVYIDGHSGFPVLQYSDIKTFGATDAATAAAGATGAAPETSAAADQLVVKGSGTRDAPAGRSVSRRGGRAAGTPEAGSARESLAWGSPPDADVTIYRWRCDHGGEAVLDS